MGPDAVVVDVRTPAEFASGHLEGAVNIDLHSTTFADEVAELDAGIDYVVYCQSGSRSAQAAATMADADLNVEDAGAIEDAASSTGLPIVP
nr:rhodanese-like domain-containing protein [uncultured Microbacterium sp.]